MNKVGCHLTPGGSKVLTALQRQQELKLSALQVFSGGRINRKVFTPPEQEWEAIRQLNQDVFSSVHAAYVINMCTPPSSQAAARSRKHLQESLSWAGNLGFDVVLFHPGSALDRSPEKARQYLITNAQSVLDKYQGPVKLLFENSAGDKRDRLVGRDLFELDQLALATDERVGLCVDTVHAFAGGYSIEEIPEVLKQLKTVQMIHFNVPRQDVTVGSRRDRHGTFADTAWSARETKDLALELQHLPLVMETRDVEDAVELMGWLA